MAARASRHYVLLTILISASIIGFILFIVRLTLFWLGYLPTFGTLIDATIVFQWVATFIFNSFSLFLGRYLQGRAKNGEEIPAMVKAVVLVMVFVLFYQIYSIVFRSWAGLAYVQLLQQQQEQQRNLNTGHGPFQPH